MSITRCRSERQSLRRTHSGERGTDVLADIQAEFSREWQRLCDDARQGALPPPSDRRFAGPAWAARCSHLLMAHAYLLSARAMSRLVDAAQVSEPLRERLRFSVMQWVDALSPSNFLALNPDAQQSIVKAPAAR